MKDTQDALMVVNQMQADGVIGKYAIGGAIAATFYIEATSTYDIDIFIHFENTPGSLIAAPSHLYDYLLPRGYKAVGEHFMIGGWQIQFLPAEDALYKEALCQSVEAEVGGVKTWVMRAEHLMAIALKTGRVKDLTRVGQFVENHAYDETELNQILERHNLVEKWEKFKKLEHFNRENIESSK